MTTIKLNNTKRSKRTASQNGGRRPTERTGKTLVGQIRHGRCNLINGILTVEAEKIEWPEDAEPKFTKKRATSAIRSAYDTKTKRYIYNNTNTVAPSKPIRLELGDVLFHFCYHLVRKEHVKIDM